MTELAPAVYGILCRHMYIAVVWKPTFYLKYRKEQAVCHFMGEPDETRHIWMKGNEAVLSPEWSIHSAAATSTILYLGNGRRKFDYGDQDFSKIDELRKV